MSLEVKNYAEGYGNGRKFDSDYENRFREENWYFKYITQNTEGKDQTVYGGDVDEDKDNYPVGTIFFDATPLSVYLSTTIKNIVVDNVPPEVAGSDIQYMVFESDYKCEITFKSDSPLDVAQLIIANGTTEEDILYKAVRKDTSNQKNGRISSEYIKNISLAKNGNIYKLNFSIDKSFDVKKLNEKQITVIVWDTSANYVKFTTDRRWYYLKRNGDNPYLSPLIIEFIDVEPQDMIVRDNVEGKTLVKVTNPNVDLREITPTIQLGEGSIGYLDTSTFTYDPTTGVMLFYVTNINTTGNVVVDAWIDVDNTEIHDVIRDETYAEGILGPFIYADDGRLYKFATYSPKFLSDEHYANFVKFTQDVLNTCHTSLETGNRIGVLEKIARIGNFNDLDKIESPLIDYIHEEYNFEVTPNFDEFLYYMYYKPEDEK